MSRKVVRVRDAVLRENVLQTQNDRNNFILEQEFFTTRVVSCDLKGILRIVEFAGRLSLPEGGDNS